MLQCTPCAYTRLSSRLSAQPVKIIGLAVFHILEEAARAALYHWKLQNVQQPNPVRHPKRVATPFQAPQNGPVGPPKRAAKPCQTSNMFSAAPVGLVTTAQVGFWALGTATTRADDKMTLLTVVLVVALGLLPYTW
jgi:hypothetical protein